MKILLIGGGGREHAIAWKLAQSNNVEHVFVAPGNGGTQKSPKMSNVDIPSTPGYFDKLSSFARDNKIELVVVGPEQPLVDGITEHFKSLGIPCFGPSSKGAKIESSKAFSKDFMKRHNIPTAAYEIFTDYEKAVQYLHSLNHSVVLKASGLAAGKGVLLPENMKEAEDGLKQIMINKEFGQAGEEVVIEERLNGPEVSVFAFSDGYTVVPLIPAQDHKRIYENDEGPNTGGMGAYCPTPMMTPKLLDDITKSVLKPTVDGLRKEGTPYVGLLYAGILMDEKKGIQVLEFNCRFGDPETQAVLLTLETDLASIILACVEGRLDSVNVVSNKDLYAVTVVLASAGYPGSYEKGKVISGLDKVSSVDDVVVFHAGTVSDKEGRIVTSGGRVLNVSARGTSLQSALSKAYEAIASIQFEGMYYRKDIAHRALNATAKSTTYKEAGVDIDSGDALVERIKPLTKATARLGTDAKIGGFGGLFDLKAIGYKDPIFVSGTDGVGTKLLIAQKVGKHDTIGIDLVAMSVNDCLVHGAEPLFFLDYYSCGKLEVENAASVISGIADGCKQSNCALVGGETAEMPGLYPHGEYDLAGFAVAVVERDEILPKALAPGDVILGLASSGIHSNGYSLVRYLTEKNHSYFDAAPFQPEKKLYEVLLEPTRVYVKSCLKAIRTGHVKALAHITGGGLTGNVPRVFDDSISGEFDLSSWPLLPVFQFFQKLGNIKTEELLRTFNCGIGMVLVVSPGTEETVMETLRASGESVYKIGRIITRQEAEGKEIIYKNEFKMQ